MSVVRQIAFPDIVWVYLKRVMKEGNLNTSVVTVKAVMYALGLKDTYGTWRWETDYPPIRKKIAKELAEQLGSPQMLQEASESEDPVIIPVDESRKVAKSREGWFGTCDRCDWVGKPVPTVEEAKGMASRHVCL